MDFGSKPQPPLPVTPLTIDDFCNTNTLQHLYCGCYCCLHAFPPCLPHMAAAFSLHRSSDGGGFLFSPGGSGDVQEAHSGGDIACECLLRSCLSVCLTGIGGGGISGESNQTLGKGIWVRRHRKGGEGAMDAGVTAKPQQRHGRVCGKFNIPGERGRLSGRKGLGKAQVRGP